VNVIGNTIDNSATEAIQQRNSFTTGRLVLNVFNNIFSHNDVRAIDLESGQPGSLVFRAGFNDYFANGNPNRLDGQSEGTGNLTVDPRYADLSTKNFRLSSNSPLINAGFTCSPGGVANPDAAGKHRLSGRAVDLGAYENGGGTITGIVLLGTSGADALNGTSGRDILCGYNGADLLKGGGGPDFVDGGDGPDKVIGGPGVDLVLGHSGDDILCTRDGTSGDVADGGSGSDRAETDGGDTRISVEGSGGC
jgi:Ca2+-binding RTX toxin-like protein